MKQPKTFLLAVSFTMLMIALLAGCGGRNEVAPPDSSAAEAEKTANGSTEAQSDGGTKLSDQPITLTGWVQYSPPPAEGITSYNDHLLWKEIPKRTNITVKWETTADDYKQQLGLIMASGDLPDIIGRVDPLLAEQYGRQGALQPLEELIKEHAPNLQKILDENPRIKAQVTSPDGHIYFFPRLLLDPRTRSYAGFMIRGDWLEKVGMEVPQTTDDLYNVLKAFKEQDPNGNGRADEIPFTADPRPIIWAFGVGSRGTASQDDFFVEDGKIKYGPADPRYKEALIYLNKLYSEGLLDNEYEGMKSADLDARITQELSGFMFGSNAGYLTKYNKLLEGAGKNPGFIAMEAPQGPTGERHIIGRHNEIDPGVGVAISSTTKYAVEITKLMDFFYTEEGSRLLNFGIEGDTYVMKDGVPVYTEKVTNHPTLDVLNYLNAYVGHVSTWASINLPEHYLATLSEEGRRGNELAVKHASEKKIPSLRFTEEEMREVQTLQRDINTYVDENINKFIRGIQSFDQYDNFLLGLQRIGSNRLLELYNIAYERFNEIVK